MMQKFLTLVAIFGLITNNIISMELEPIQSISCAVCKSNLNNFWQKVKDGIISQEKAQKKLCGLYASSGLKESRFDQELKQALCAGVSPSMAIDSQRNGYDIMAYALKNNVSLVNSCFEHGYSPDSLVLLGRKKTPALN